MPEFRFRRRKQQKRRQTLLDAEESAAHIQAAKKQIQSEGASGKGVRNEKNSTAQDSEKFLELLRGKHPSDATRIELDHVLTNGEEKEEEEEEVDQRQTSTVNGHGPNPEEELTSNQDDFIQRSSSSQLSPVKTTLVRRISSRYSECLFLQYGEDLRRCPMPSPITLSTIKNLFVNMFGLSPSLLEDTQCSILLREKDTHQWRPLGNTSNIHDHCILLLVDSQSDRTRSHTHSHTPNQDSEINMPLTDLDETFSSQRSQGSCDSQESQESSKDVERLVMSEASAHKSLQKSVYHNGPTSAKMNNGLWRTDMGHRLADLTALPDSLPIHQPHPSTTCTTLGSPLSLTSCTSGVGSEIRAQAPPTRDCSKLVTRTHSLHLNVRDLKQEITTLKHDHATALSDFQQTMMITGDRILAAIETYRKIGGIHTEGREEFRHERLELYPQKDVYTRRSQHTFRELSILETAVEEMRVDVVERRCKVVMGEVEGLLMNVKKTQKAATDLKARYIPLEIKLKRVMEQELQVIVKEERFLQEEGSKVNELEDRCRKLLDTLKTLDKYALVQSHRTPLVPYFVSTTDPDRQALMENIEAITPNHMHRMECIKMSEFVQKKKKEFSSPKVAVRRFENQLKAQRNSLRPTGNIMEIENRRQMKIKAGFFAEKFEREKRIAEEKERQRKIIEKRRQEERKEIEEKWLREHNERVQRRKSTERRLQQAVEQSVLSEESSGEPRSQKRVTLVTKPSGIADDHFDADAPQRANLAASASFRNVPNHPPRDQTSIGYSRDFETYDTLLPKKGSTIQRQHSAYVPRPHLIDSQANGAQVSPPRVHRQVQSFGDSQVVLRPKKTVTGPVPNRHGVYEPVESGNHSEGAVAGENSSRLQQGSSHIKQRSLGWQDHTAKTAQHIRSSSDDSVFLEDGRQAHYQTVGSHYQNQDALRYWADNKASHAQNRRSMVVSSEWKQSRNVNHIDPTASSITSVAVSPGQKRAKFHHTYTQFTPHYPHPHKPHSPPTKHRTVTHGESANKAVASRPTMNIVDSTRVAFSDHRLAKKLTSDKHTAVSVPTQLWHPRPEPQNTWQNQHPPHAHGRNAPHQHIYSQPEDVPLTSYPRFRVPPGHAPSAGVSSGRAHHHWVVSSGRLTHYPNHSVRSSVVGSLV